MVRTHIADKRLGASFSVIGVHRFRLHLYYPSRRQPASAFALLIDALRYPVEAGKSASQLISF